MAISGPTDLGTASVDQAINAVLTLSTAVAAGSCVIVTTVNATATRPASVTDSSGNTYTELTFGVTGSSHTEVIYAALNVTALGVGATITVTPGRADVSTAMGASAWTGVATTAALDGTASGASGATDANGSVGPVTASTSDQLLFCVFGTTSASATRTVGADWTPLHTARGVTTFVRSLYSQYRILSASGNYTATCTFNEAVNWAGAVAGLKSGAPPPTLTTTRPNATTAAGGWTTGAASLHAALSDQSDATIITGTGA